MDITRIVNLLNTTPYGSMSMNDFRRQQFVLVDGVLKLSDVDDAGFEDPICITDEDCQIVFTSTNMSYRFVEIYRRNIGQAHSQKRSSRLYTCMGNNLIFNF